MSVVDDMLTYLEREGIGKRGVTLRSRPDNAMMGELPWNRVFVKSDPSYIYPDKVANVDTHRIRISATGDRGTTGYEKCFELISDIYKACRLTRNITINGTFYPIITTVQAPYDSNFFTGSEVSEMTIQMDVTRYTPGYLEYEVKS